MMMMMMMMMMAITKIMMMVMTTTKTGAYLGHFYRIDTLEGIWWYSPIRG